MDIRFIFTDTLTDGLQTAIAANSDFSPALAAIADLLEESTRYRFEIGQDPDGEDWIPSQRAIEEGGQTLVDSSRLLSSIVSTSDRNSALVGTNVIYAGVHQFGATIRGRSSKTKFGPAKPRVLPARAFLGFSPADVERVEEELTEHLIAGGFTS